MTIHWCGTGLSAVPGLRRLIEAGHVVTVWNRSLGKAQDAVGDITNRIQVFDQGQLAAELQRGDVVVSMLPGEWHVPLAELCISKCANMVSSSYISPEMMALDTDAKRAGVALVNEVGLDPGIDHLMAHWLVADYRGAKDYDKDAVVSFISYCGGVPKHPNAFRYKFSWSPLGVLKALRSPSRSIRAFSELSIQRPWDAITSYVAPLGAPESFEVYPNRDSIPFIKQYDFDDAWQIREFVRGTLRLNGWAEAWADVFSEIETLEGPEGEARLKEMSDTFWADYAYDKGEPDRVILCVALKAEVDGIPIYNKTYTLDAWGDLRGSAMARLVSVTVSLAVEAVQNHEIQVGVTAAPHDRKLIDRWLSEINGQSQHMQVVDHVGH